MVKLQSDSYLVMIEKRDFAHKLASKIEEIGLSDEQRAIFLIDVARCFENQELASAVSMTLREHLEDRTRIGKDEDC